MRVLDSSYKTASKRFCLGHESSIRKIMRALDSLILQQKYFHQYVPEIFL